MDVLRRVTLPLVAPSLLPARCSAGRGPGRVRRPTSTAGLGRRRYPWRCDLALETRPDAGHPASLVLRSFPWWSWVVLRDALAGIGMSLLARSG